MKQYIKIAPIIAIFGIACSSAAQLGDLRDKIQGLKIPGLDRFTKSPTLLTYRLQSARVPTLGLKNVEPVEWTPIQPEWVTEEGNLRLTPGFYSGRFQSFCFRGYTPGPNRGAAYLPTPVEGPLAPTLSRIVRYFESNQSVSQSDIQLLIWAILARTKPSLLPEPQRQLLAKILTVKDLAQLEGAGLEVLQGPAFESFKNSLNPTLRSLFESDNLLRDLVANSAPYQEVERLAVLPPTEEGNMPFFDQSMWTAWGDSAYIRLRPAVGESLAEYYVPQDVQIWKDAYGRIKAMTFESGVSIVTDYDDSVAPAVGDDPTLVCYSTVQTVAWVPNPMQPSGFDRLVIEGSKPLGFYDPDKLYKRFKVVPSGENIGGEVVASLNPDSWVESTASVVRSAGLAYQSAKELIAIGNRRRAAQSRKELAKEAASGLKEMKDSLENDPSDDPTIINHDHYKEGLEAVKENDPKAKAEFLGNHGAGMVDSMAQAIKDIRGLDTGARKRKRGEPEANNPPGAGPNSKNPPPGRGGPGGGGPGGGGPGGVGPGTGPGGSGGKTGGGGKTGSGGTKTMPGPNAGGAKGGGSAAAPTNGAHQWIGLSNRVST